MKRLTVFMVACHDHNLPMIRQLWLYLTQPEIVTSFILYTVVFVTAAATFMATHTSVSAVAAAAIGVELSFLRLRITVLNPRRSCYDFII